jgi:hypothetical protein
VGRLERRELAREFEHRYDKDDAELAHAGINVAEPVPDEFHQLFSVSAPAVPLPSWASTRIVRARGVGRGTDRLTQPPRMHVAAVGRSPRNTLTILP